MAGKLVFYGCIFGVCVVGFVVGFLLLVGSGQLPSKHSPDSSGSPLLCVGIGDAAATADSGTGCDASGGCGLQKIIMSWVIFIYLFLPSLVVG